MNTNEIGGHFSSIIFLNLGSKLFFYFEFTLKTLWVLWVKEKKKKTQTLNPSICLLCLAIKVFMINCK